jgi:peptidoglycan-associated lipoprotein
MVKRCSQIALVLLISAPILVGCAKSPSTTSDASSPSAGGSMAGSADGGRGVGSAAGPGGSYAAQGNPNRPNPKEFATMSQLADVRFDFDRYDIRPQDNEVLDASAESLKSHPKLHVLIEGHADQRGTSEYNLALADRRAKASMNYLVSRGVRSNRITIISYGKERPMCAEPSEDCWSQNRRAHFLVKAQ